MKKKSKPFVPKKLVIDRIEDCYALCEDGCGTIHEIKLKQISKGAKEGDVIVQSRNGRFVIDRVLTKQRHKEVFAIQQKAFTRLSPPHS